LGLTNISDKFLSLKNLEYLNLNGNAITSILSKLANSKKLEYIYLSYNKIDEELPEFLNDFENLRVIELLDNKNITGKTLTNDKIEHCSYASKYDLCIPKQTKCLNNKYYNFKYCQGTNGETSNGRCGKDFGKCPNNQCCSKYGWCGSSNLFCDTSEGCQSEFGKCNGIHNNDDDDHVSNDERCGEGHGKCPESQCCSKFGWCGNSYLHCSPEEGCQSEFGKCHTSTSNNDDTKPNLLENLPITTNGQCNDKDGRCKPGSCCSKHGWCGTGEKYCGAGCQSQFGNCN